MENFKSQTNNMCFFTCEMKIAVGDSLAFEIKSTSLPFFIGGNFRPSVMSNLLIVAT